MPKSKHAMTVARIATTLTILAAGPTLAQAATDPRVAARIDHFKTLAAHFKTMNEELRKRDPDLKVVRAATKKVSDAAVQLPSWFPKGSGPESGAKTRAKPELWTNSALFATNARNLRTEAEKLRKLSAGDDVDAMKLQAKAVGAECAACHTDFRTER